MTDIEQSNDENSEPTCELCQVGRAEHFIKTPWGDRHCCTQCAESLPRGAVAVSLMPTNGAIDMSTARLVTLRIAHYGEYSTHLVDPQRLLDAIDTAKTQYMLVSLDGSKPRSNRPVRQPALVFLVGKYKHRLPTDRLGELADKCQQAIAGEPAEFVLGQTFTTSSVCTSVRTSTL